MNLCQLFLQAASPTGRLVVLFPFLYFLRGQGPATQYLITSWWQLVLFFESLKSVNIRKGRYLYILRLFDSDVSFGNSQRETFFVTCSLRNTVPRSTCEVERVPLVWYNGKIARCCIFTLISEIREWHVPVYTRLYNNGTYVFEQKDVTAVTGRCQTRVLVFSHRDLSRIHPVSRLSTYTHCILKCKNWNVASK